MKRFALLGLGLALAACSKADGELDAANIGVSRVTAKVEYNSADDTYTVTPVDGDPVIYTGDASGDVRGFDFAWGPDLLAFLAAREEDGTSAVLLVQNTLDASSAAVLLTRPDDSNMPTEGSATYLGDYLSAFFVNDVYTGSITGDATVNVDFDERDIDGSIENRFYVGVLPSTTTPVLLAVADVTLSAGDLTRDGQVSGIGLASAAPASTTGTIDLNEAFTNTSGSYRGLISGTDGAYFIGGVELIYLGDGATPSTAREIGAIFAPILPPP